MQQPVLSVIIPCYNQARFLPQAVDSALNQTYPAVEIIVVDDGSTDNTREIALGYGDRVKLASQPNAGLPGARNAGLRLATGDYCCFLDSDDFLHPDYAALQMAAARESPETAVIAGESQHCDLSGEPFRGRCYLPLDGEDPLHFLQRRNPWPPHAVVVRRDVVEKVGSFDPTLKSCEDWDLWMRIAGQGGSFKTITGPLAYYRRYEGSMSTFGDRMLKSSLTVLRRSRQYHPGCRICRTNIQRGATYARVNYLIAPLQELRRQQKANGQWASYVLSTLRLWRNHPEAILRFIEERILRRSPCRME